MIKENFSLNDKHTFGFRAKARYYLEIHSEDEFIDHLKEINQIEPILILGKGSNIVFTGDYPGLVISNRIEGIETVRNSDQFQWLRIGGGEDWENLIEFALDNDLAGLENLTRIPGTVGAAPIQNIGAYGAELSDIFEELEAIEVRTGKIVTFDREACGFGYRDSLFKREAKGKYFISRVTLRLSRKVELNLSYQALRSYFENEKPTTVREVRDAVSTIRASKLPDPKEIGNAGSFFKNPIISKSAYSTLKETYPEIPGYTLDNGVKVAAGWLIQEAGWKGKWLGNVGVHPRQALVLVHNRKGSPDELVTLMNRIRSDVRTKFGIDLEPEVNLI